MCFFLSRLQNHTCYLQAIKLSQSSDCIPHHPKSCIHLPQFSLCFSLSYQFPLTGGSSLMPPRYEGGRFLPVSRWLKSGSPAPAEMLQTSPTCLVPDPLTHSLSLCFALSSTARVGIACPGSGSPAGSTGSAQHDTSSSLLSSSPSP